MASPPPGTGTGWDLCPHSSEERFLPPRGTRAATRFHRNDAHYMDDVAGALVIETFLGPLTFGGAWDNGRQPKIFFSLGRFFWGQHQAGSQLEASYP